MEEFKIQQILKEGKEAKSIVSIKLRNTVEKILVIPLHAKSDGDTSWFCEIFTPGIKGRETWFSLAQIESVEHKII